MAIKRRASTTASSANKKPRSTTKQCSLIEAALLGAEQIPLAVRQMLSKNLGDNLGVPKEDRHEYQHKVIGQIGEVLAGVRTGFQTRISNAEEKLSASTVEKETRAKKAEEASAAVAEKGQAIVVATAELDTSSKAVKEAEKALKSAKTEKAQEDKAVGQVLVEKTKLEVALLDSYEPLKRGELEGSSLKHAIDELAAIGKELQFDMSMLTSLHSAFAKAQADRGSFDLMVWEQFETDLKKNIEVKTTALAEAQVTQAEKGGALETAQAGLENAKNEVDKCKATLDEHKAALESLKADHKAAAAAVASFGPEMKQVEKELAAAKQEFDAFVKGASTCYEELVQYTAIPPVTADADQAQ